MSSYLDRIIKTKVEVVEQQKAHLTLSEIQHKLENIFPTRDFIKTIESRNIEGQISVIAEVKKASPSKGVIRIFSGIDTLPYGHTLRSQTTSFEKRFYHRRISDLSKQVIWCRLHTFDCIHSFRRSTWKF